MLQEYIMSKLLNKSLQGDLIDDDVLTQSINKWMESHPEFGAGIQESTIVNIIKQYILEHPELTTTVQNGSISKEKLNSELLAEITNAASNSSQAITDLRELETTVNNKANATHTHSYAGSSSAGGAANSANKINTNAGSATQPVYFANGVPVATTHTLGKSVPSDAKFTDTTYSAATTSAAGLMSAADKTKLDGITSGANNITIDSTLSSTSTNPVQNKVVNDALAGKAASSHTHNYAGSASAGGAANSANKINTNAGSTTQPVYFANGVPVATTYSLGKSVPSDAKFTDTTYSAATTSASGLMSAADKTKLNGIAEGANKTTVDSSLSSTSTNPVQNKVVNDALAGKAASSHTHSYAGSSSAGGAATSANKINTNAGSVTQPVYFANGVPVATTHTLGASVPSNAKFTDTTYNYATTSNGGLMTSGDKLSVDGLEMKEKVGNSSQGIDVVYNDYFATLRVQRSGVNITGGNQTNKVLSLPTGVTIARSFYMILNVLTEYWSPTGDSCYVTFEDTGIYVRTQNTYTSAVVVGTVTIPRKWLNIS